MSKFLEEMIRRQAQGRCEYCHSPETALGLRHVLDHVTAIQHGGKKVPMNLALACVQCNLHKGPNLTGIDPETGNIASLFHPRRDSWNDHFRYNGPVLVGLTSTGRTTVAVLAINHPLRIAARQLLIEAGTFPQ